MKKIIFLIFILCSCNSKAQIKELEQELKIHFNNRLDKKKDVNKIIKSYQTFREKLFNQIQHDTILKSDTIILLETIDIQSFTYSGTIWTNSRHINFESNLDNINLDDKNIPIYSYFIINNLKAWKLSNIREREKQQGKLLGGNYVVASIIINTEKRTEVLTTGFDEFLDSLN